MNSPFIGGIVHHLEAAKTALDVALNALPPSAGIPEAEDLLMLAIAAVDEALQMQLIHCARVELLDDLIHCAAHELGYREEVYPRRVAARVMPQALADREIARMRAILGELLRLKQREAEEFSADAPNSRLCPTKADTHE